MADTPGRIAVLVNAGAGHGCPPDLATSLKAKFCQRGLHARVHLIEHGPDLLAAARDAVQAGAGMVAAAGGDGTVSAVASQLVGTQVVLGVLPMGTLNHFAKDLGLPLDVDHAIDVLAHGRVGAVDVGQVNDRVFINNSSIGIYPDIVLDRERQRRRLGRSKWPALAVACLKVLQRYPTLAIQLAVEGDKLPARRSPFVFIGNNRYEIAGFEIGNRKSLEEGRLSLYMAHHGGRFGLLRLAVQAMLGRLQQADDFETLDSTELEIQTRRRAVHVSADGEVMLMQPPLHYRIRAGALKVMRPLAPGPASATPAPPR
ncbi:MAG: diacylglycerol kinase family protein [Ramlibacter sp.]